MDHQPIVLPIRLQPSNLRPIAYRILSKKHGLNIKSDALKILADYIGPKFGSEWKSAKSQYFLEEIARVWKEQDRGLFIDGEGLGEVMKEIDSLNTKLAKKATPSNTTSAANHAVQTSVDALIAGRRDTTVDEVLSEDDNVVSRTSPPTSVSPPPIRDSLNWNDHFKVINAFDQPLFDYNHHRKQYELSKTKDSKFSSTSVNSNIALFQRRFHIVKDRVLRNENFQASSFSAFSSFQGDSENNSITQIKNLLGRDNQRFMLFGMLTLLNGDWHLQDHSDKIQLDISQAEPNIGSYYVPGNMVLCDGIHSSGKFYCSSMGHPPGERRADTLEANGNIDFLGIHANLRIDKDLNTKLKLLEREMDHKIIILGSNCHLDDLKTLDALTKLFLRLSEQEQSEIPISIIFNGSFASSPKHSSEYKNLFDSLASILDKYPVIAGNVSLVFVPGENDQWQTPLWPKQTIPHFFGSRINKACRNVRWASNPTRMVYLSQELVIVRDDLGARLRRNTVLFPKINKNQDSDEEDDDEGKRTEIERLESLPPKVSEARKVVKTILDQGHLTPFVKSLKPVIWHLDHTLHLSPIPSVLILSDPTSPAFDVTYNGCRCLNPGILIQKKKLSYIEYGLSSKKAEMKELYF